MPSVFSIAASLAGIVLACWVLLRLAVDSLRFGITPLPSSRQAVAVCLRWLHELGSHADVIDLGCGLGTVVHALAQATPQSRVTGIEGSRLVYNACRLFNRLRRAPPSRCRWQCGDFMRTDLSGYDGVYCYLYAGAMTQLGPKLRRELRPGAWVISNTFALPGWQPERVMRLRDWYRTPMYLYRQTSDGLAETADVVA